jgi:hypothetical protein
MGLGCGPTGRKAEAGPSTPLKNASLRMTEFPPQLKMTERLVIREVKSAVKPVPELLRQGADGGDAGA